MTEVAWTVGEPEALVLDADGPLAAMFHLSPYVWRRGAEWWLAVRAVPDSEHGEEKISRVHLGTSQDGVHFTMDAAPVLAPGPDRADDDADGCEDPTVVDDPDGGLACFYSGWNQAAEEGRLLSATSPGSDAPGLIKRGRVLAEPNRYTNAKEASVLQLADGTWRLFFEYADGRSLIGLAEAPALEGPWSPCPDPFTTRDDAWDSFHLSPGPLVGAGTDRPVLFYNGANEDTQWRIGWVELDPTCRSIVARADEPLITPPEPEGDDRDIAFSASAVEDGEDVWLYYSLSDRYLCRVRLTAT